MKEHALGLVIADRWNLTQKTLQSLFHTDQYKESYDFYIIDNGSEPDTANAIKEWAQNGLMPVKSVIRTHRLSIGPAWNLFLDLAKDYKFRTKLDNDLIFANTPVTVGETTRTRGLSYRTGMSPGDSGVNPGAIPVASFTMGAGNRVMKRENNRSTCFLDHLKSTIQESNLGIAALAPVAVGKTLKDTLPMLAEKRWRNSPCLVGGCMTVTKSCFDVLGYFDESLPCSIDVEYSQRAMGKGINVGYVHDYCVVDLGETQPTLSLPEREKNRLAIQQLAFAIPIQREYIHTKWEKVHDKIRNASDNNLIVNLVS